MRFTSINPASEDVVASFGEMDPKDVHDMVGRAYTEQKIWAQCSFEHRARIVSRLADILMRDIEVSAALITQEMGKPIGQSRSEILKCAETCRYIAALAPTALATEELLIDGSVADITYAPLGVVVAIMPWNFPFWQFFRFAAPALMAGNGIILKHAPSTFGCAINIVEVCREAGIPDDLVQCVMIDVPQIEVLIGDARVRAVTFTGSTRGGEAVAQIAGRHIKKVVLELGGNDAYIVCDDADLGVAVDACVVGRCLNAGQSCIAAKRFIVHASIADEFTKRVAARFDAMVVGDPMDPATEIGPIARADLRDTLLDQLQHSMMEGARQVTKRSVNDIPKRGFYVPPVLIDNITTQSRLFREEVFGPVASVIAFNSDEEAVELANDSRYGLGAAVFSQDLDRARALAERIECGMVAINDFVRSDMRLPFGGTRYSGYGRELGVAGVREFTNIKVIRTK
ncbi:MAG: NAD-dependent succinate-semialdehyde dehydrogenase [Ignavibacteria bacterium]|nr:NAD-dependent succinate-semialdehyde dehydrogenase [Ignavibacteria bacterium]